MPNFEIITKKKTENDASFSLNEALKKFDNSLEKSFDAEAFNQEIERAFSSSGTAKLAETTFPVIEEEQSYEEEFVNITKMPPPEKDFTAFYETPVVQRAVTQASTFGVKINLRGKLVLAVFSLSFLCLIFLALFNAFALGKVNGNIARLDGAIASEEVVLNMALEAYNALTDEERLALKAQDAGFGVILDGQIVRMDLLPERGASMDFKQKNNWFNDFCNFLSKVFGG